MSHFNEDHQEQDQVRDRQQYRTHHHLDEEEGQDDDQDALFDNLLCKNETLEPEGAEGNADLYGAYFSNQGRGRKASNGYVKPRGLSFEDLAASPESDHKAATTPIPKSRKESTQ